MIRFLRHIILSLLFIFVLGLADGWGQDAPIEQHVCQDASVTYHMFGFNGSDVQWSIVDLSDKVKRSEIYTITNTRPHDTQTEYFKNEFTHAWTAATYPTGVYTLKILETNGTCSGEKELKVNLYSKPAVPVVTVNQMACYGEQGGLSVDLSGVRVPPALSLQIRLVYAADDSPVVGKDWANTSGTSHVFSDLLGGDYKIQIRYVLGGNQVRGSVVASPINTLVNPPLLTVSSAAVTTPIACNGGDAEVTIVASGGTAPYTYTLNGVSNDTGLFMSKAGTYSYHVNDANGCATASSDLSIAQPTPLLLTLESTTDVDCAGEATGAIDIDVTGGETTALSFDGTQEPISLGTSALNNLTAFTLEGWVQFLTDKSSGQHSFFGQNNVIEFGFESGNLTVWTVSGGSAFYPYANYPTDGNWHHVAATGNGTTLKLYIDGVEVASGGSGTPSYGSSTDPLRIGAGVWNETASSNAFDGQMSTVRFWNVARKEAQIKSGMNQDMDGSESGLIAAYKLDEGSGTSIGGVGSSAPDLSINSAFNTKWINNAPVYSYNWTRGGVPVATTQDLTDVIEGDYHVTVTTRDGCTVSETYTIGTDVDNVNPIALCQDIIIQLDVSGSATISAADIDNGSSDNCGIASMSVSPSSFDCSNVGENTVTLTVIDNKGNTATCTSKVKVEDDTPPNAVCQDITIQLDDSGNASITAAQINNGSNDACGIANLAASQTDFTVADIGINTVILTVTDNNGNTSTCEAKVTVEDNVAPTASCQDITVYLDATGNVSITAAQIDNGSSDASGIQSLSVSPSSFDCSNVGGNPVTLTVTDKNGNVSTCTATVTVVDNLAPTINCVPNKSVNVDAGSCSALVNGLAPTTADNCSVVLQTWTLSGATAANSSTTGINDASGQTFNVGTTTVTYTIEDAAGNEATCSFDVTVTKENNISLVDVTGTTNPESDAGFTNGTHCPDLNGLQAVIEPSGNTYSPGTSQVQFRVNRLCDTGAWSFNYSIGGTGVTVHEVLISGVGTTTNASGVVNADAGTDYILFTIDINNVVGTILPIDFTISDGGTDSAIKDAITIQHNLKIIPQIVGFE
ncbi:LamG-like jellyroll fold domain-containing protein [Marinifilum sp. D714]|uniref:LamG-like jellyroll fold domain-containing protein n=1 Tax=Marinifilum sp. D714 TaxID=2937523 RepID=UPI0027BCBBB7|nr:LamG-like jellyroll fold domain-containing protein [Marinifilum sp. D714]MDQ2179492.1 HYR domain-containing protein [Marinifilum sp. D714]